MSRRYFVDCSVLGHECFSLPFLLLLGKLLPVFALAEFSVIRFHLLVITALLSQLSPILIQVCSVVINSADCVTDLDDDAEEHEEASDSKADNDSDQIGSLELRVFTVARVHIAEIISIALSRLTLRFIFGVEGSTAKVVGEDSAHQHAAKACKKR